MNKYGNMPKHDSTSEFFVLRQIYVFCSTCSSCKDLESKANVTCKDLILDLFLMHEKFGIGNTDYGK